MNGTESARPFSERRVAKGAPWVMLARKLVVVIASIVLLVTLCVYFGLARHEREVLVRGRVATAVTVLRYLSGSLAPEVSFGDEKSIGADLQNLARDEDLLGVDVWAVEAEGLQSLGSAGRPIEGVPDVRGGADAESVSIGGTDFTVLTRIAGPEGNGIGVVRASFSLARVNASLQASLRRTIWICSLVALGVAVVLLVAVRQSLLRPLHQMRVARELEIASDIQRAMLPKRPEHADFEFAGAMVPADEVGGDFYDVQSAAQSLWITIGDVSGHGLPAGLIMLMAQSAFAAHFAAAPDAPPESVFRAVNHLLWDNIARRLKDDKYVTCQLLAYRGDGEFAVVGGHQTLLVFRAATGRVEAIEAPGPWLGIMQTLPEVPTHPVRLAPGDVLCLYSDGVTEASNARHELYDLPRLEKLATRVLGAEASDLEGAVKKMFDDLFAFCGRPQDDASLLLVRRRAKPLSL